MVRILLILLLFPSLAFGGTFEWDANTEPDLAGYRIYCEGTKLYDLALIDNISLRYVKDGSYTIRAFDVYGNESEDSNAVIVTAYYYNTVRYDYETDIVKRLIYKGEHTDQNASVGDVNWIITHYYYVGDVLSYTRTRTTSWTLRTVGW